MRLSATLLVSTSLLALPVYADSQPATPQEEMATAQNMRQSGDAPGAVKMLRGAVDKQPQNPELLKQFGDALIAAGRAEEAVGVFDRLIALDPHNAAAYNAKGVAFDHTGNHLAAQELYQHALSIDPESLSIQNNLAMSLILNDQLDPAIALLEKLNLQYANNKTVRQNLALAYGIKGDKERALALNMKDLPPDEARENLRFYDAYARQRKTLKSDGASSVNIGFADTPAPIAAAAEKETVKEKATADVEPPKEAIAPPPEEDVAKGPKVKDVEPLPEPVEDRAGDDESPSSAVAVDSVDNEEEIPHFPTQIRR